MEYSDKYAVDLTEQKYGVEYKYSKQIKDIMTLNSDFDESILYTKTKVTDFETMYQLPIQMNKNANSNWEYTLSKTIKDSTVYVAKVRDDLEEVIEKHGVVFTDSGDSLDKFYFGYNIDKNAVVGKSGGNRFLLDFRIKNIIFKVKLSGYKKSDVEGWLNKTSDNTISASDIPFDELYENPDDYYINKCEISSQGIYNADENKYSVYTGYRVFTTINAKKIATGLTPANSFNYNIALNSTAPFTFNLMAKGFTGGMTSNKLSKLDKTIDYVDFRDVVLEPYSDFIGDEASKTYYGKNEILKETDKYVIFGCHRASTTAGNKLNNYLVDVKIVFKPKAILTFLATLGVYFVGNGTSISANLSNYNPDTIIDAVGTYTKTDGTTGDAYVYLGEMDDNGFTTGKLLRSEELKNYNGYNKDGNSKNDNFDPGKTPGGDDDDESDDINFGGSYAGLGAFAKFYLCSGLAVSELNSWINGRSPDWPENFDPMTQIISVSRFATDISSASYGSTTIKFHTAAGAEIDTKISALHGNGDNIELDLGSVNIPLRMKERGIPFLDYESTIELYIPACGTFILDPQTVLGSTLSVKMWLSTSTGECNSIAYVTRNGVKAPVAYGSGSLAVPMPVTSIGWGSYLAAVTNANIKYYFGSLGAGASGMQFIDNAYSKNEFGMASGFSGIVGSFQGAAQAEQNLAHLKNSSFTSVSGSFGSTAAWNYPFNAYVKITRRHFKKPSNYAHTRGIPLVETKTLSDCSGFTICVNADVTSINATLQEKNMIVEALNNGVIV